MEKSRDSVAEALKLMRQTVLKDRAAEVESLALAPDLGELFLAELQSRRELLEKWLRLIKEEAGVSGLPSRSRKPVRKCRSLASGSRTDRIGRRQMGGVRRSPPALP